MIFKNQLSKVTMAIWEKTSNKKFKRIRLCHDLAPPPPPKKNNNSQGKNRANLAGRRTA